MSGQSVPLSDSDGKLQSVKVVRIYSNLGGEQFEA